MNFDLVICGAGPAGLAAASEGINSGLSVALIDEQTTPGGQIYRNISNVSDQRAQILGTDYMAGYALTKLPENLHYISNAKIWNVEKDGTVVVSISGETQIISGTRILLCTGALERPVPIQGWTLPGVMGVGAAQILLKSSGVIPTDTVLAGSGPLLYLFAAQLIRAGVPPKALIETQGFSDYLHAAMHPLAALSGCPHIIKGLSLISEIRKAGIPRFLNARNLQIHGKHTAESITFKTRGKTKSLNAANILLHQGIVPNIQITQSLDLDHFWHKRMNCFVPSTNVNGRSSDKKFFIAGDGAGIAGAKIAEAAGAFSALAIAQDLGKKIDSKRQRRLKKTLKVERKFRPFIERLYQPPAEIIHPADNIRVCRCEEITAGAIRKAAANGAMGPNHLKSMTRAGMGPCQGRYCGLTVTQILAKSHGETPSEMGYYNIRPPLKPVSIGELANIKNGISNN